jgi:hypothetical protein
MENNRVHANADWTSPMLLCRELAVVRSCLSHHKQNKQAGISSNTMRATPMVSIGLTQDQQHPQIDYIPHKASMVAPGVPSLFTLKNYQ